MRGKKNWIAEAVKKPGALRAKMGVKKGERSPLVTGSRRQNARQARPARSLCNDS